MWTRAVGPCIISRLFAGGRVDVIRRYTFVARSTLKTRIFLRSIFLLTIQESVHLPRILILFTLFVGSRIIET